MGEDGELLDRDGFVAILSFTNHFKTQAKDVRDGALEPIGRCDWHLLESEQEEKVVTQMVLK